MVPSHWEGFGLVAVEAMQARTAVFASKVGGLKGETGFLFDLDDVDGLVAAIPGTSIETLAE